MTRLHLKRICVHFKKVRLISWPCYEWLLQICIYSQTKPSELSRKLSCQKKTIPNMMYILCECTLVSGLYIKVQATISNDNFLESLNKKPSSVKISMISINQEKMVKTFLFWLFEDIFRHFHYCFH